MKDKDAHIKSLLAEIEELKNQLFDSTSIIDAIKDGSVDALVLHKDGQPQIYSIESADYTYRILIEKFGEGALSITDDGLVLYCNDYFSKLIGMPAAKITGSYFASYVADKSEFFHLMAALKHGPSKGELSLDVNGVNIPIYVSLTDLHPTVAAVGVVVTDLTEKKKNEEALILHQHELELKVNELNASNKSLGEFIHVISHDLKEPLRKILMYASRLDLDKIKVYDENERKYIEVIKSSTVRLDNLVDDIVKYAFINNKAPESEINLNEVLADVLEDLELMIEESGAVIETCVLPRITASRVQMRQLFSNLVTNGIKYTKHDVKPHISITCGEDRSKEYGKFYKISVVDNGIGIAEKHVSKIFTIFQRLHFRDEYSGNGIGLAICKKIMENHSGRIEVESNLGEGSTFNLYFPLTKTF